MTSNVVLKDKAAVILLNEIHQDPVLKAQLELYFKPYCDCDITEWIAGQVDLNNQPVINKILELIAFRDNFPITRGGPQPVLGQLLKQYCNGNDFVGIYADGNGGQVQKTIEVNSESQGCKQPETIKFYLPWESQRALVNAGSDGVIFSDEPAPVPGESLIGGQKIFFSSPRTPRLQIKIGGLEAGDYQNLSVKIFSMRDADGQYPDNLSGKVPFNTIWNDWDGALSAVYDPITRVTKLQSYYSTTAAGAVYLAYMRGTKVIGWVRLNTSRFDYDASTNLPTPFMTFIANPVGGVQSV